MHVLTPWPIARRWRRIIPLAALLIALIAGAMAAVSAPNASACPPAGCGSEPNPDPTPHPTYVPVPKYRVTVQTIKPIRTQDASVDEVYATMSGQFLTGTVNLSTLTTWNLNVTRERPAPLWVELWDQDFDWPTGEDDDWLGAAYPARPTAVGSSITQTHRLTGSGAIYDVTIKVTRIS